MSEESFSSTDIYYRCYKKSLTESLVSADILNKEYGYSNTFKLVKDILKESLSEKKIPKNIGNRLITTLRLDVENDLILNKIKELNEDDYEKHRLSLIHSIDMIDNLIKNIEDFDYNQSLIYILYYDAYVNNFKPIDENKLSRTGDRVLKNANRNELEESFSALRDQYNQIFENMYKPYSYRFSELISRCSGFDKESAYEIMEDILCYKQCYDWFEDYKSDYREYRNSLAHDAYAETDENLTLTLRNKTQVTMDLKTMMEIIPIMSHKCMILQMIMPIINLEILSGINLNQPS